jgi:hypothetical protein
MITYGYMVSIMRKKVCGEFQILANAGILFSKNAMQVLTLCKHSSNYITNMGKGFYV